MCDLSPRESLPCKFSIVGTTSRLHLSFPPPAAELIRGARVPFYLVKNVRLHSNVGAQGEVI